MKKSKAELIELLENVPDDLKQFDNWVVWKEVPRDNGKISKEPFEPKTGGRASTSDPNTWGTYDKAYEVYTQLEEYNGIGFVFTNCGVMGVDVDDIEGDLKKYREGKKDNIVSELVDGLGSYAELSPSGKGIHILGYGEKPEGKCRKANVEMYDTKQFFTVTGDRIGDKQSLTDITDRLKPYYEKYLADKTPTVGTSSPQGVLSNQRPEEPDEVIINKILESKSPELFEKLFYGKGLDLTNSDTSSLDLSLANILSYWTNKNADQIDRLFKQSELYRQGITKRGFDKWERPDGTFGTYGRRTIGQAISRDIKTGNTETGSFNFPFVDDKDKPLKKWENLKALLEYQNIDVKYNKLKKTIEITGDKWNDDVIVDGRVTDIGGICEDYGFRISKDNLYDFISRLSMDNAYHPVQEYLLNCLEEYKANKDDSTGDVVEELYKTITLAEDNRTKFKLFRYWFRNAVAVAFNKDPVGSKITGSKDGVISANGVLTFLGEEGVGKSRWIRSIVPHHLEAFKDNVFIDPTNKDTVITATKYWIGELAELDSMTTKKEQSRLKGFLTSVTDDFRLPYAKTSEEMPRYSIYYGSVNKEEFLKDDTANRRYWTLEVVEADHKHDIDLNLLWGQLAYEVIEERQKFWLDQEEIQEVSEINDNHRNKDHIEITLESGYNWEVISNDKLEGVLWKWKTSNEIKDDNGFDSYQNSRIGTVYKKVLSNFGYSKADIRDRFKKRCKNVRYCRVPIGEADLRFEGRQEAKLTPSDRFMQEMDSIPTPRRIK